MPHPATISAEPAKFAIASATNRKPFIARFLPGSTRAPRRQTAYVEADSSSYARDTARAAFHCTLGENIVRRARAGDSNPEMMERGQSAREGSPSDRFEVQGTLGEGGMGVVYRAWDRTLGKAVALKRMREVGATSVHKLKSEFRARSALQHKNLVQLYELVIDGDDCFFTMELVEGTDLEAWVRHGGTPSDPVDPPDTAATDRHARPAGDTSTVAETPAGLTTEREPSSSARPHSPKSPLDVAGVARLRAAMAELCGGLAILHDAGVVHCDVKPANVRVTPDGRVVLVDFGLAASADRSAGRVVAGTPRYMAPEQVRAETTTAAADMYAIGGILYELLAGRSAFGGVGRLVQAHKASGAFADPIGPGTPDDELARLAMDLLAPNPEARPDAREVLARLAPSGRVESAGPTFGLPVPGGFMGRVAELLALERALANVETEQRPRAVLVEGASSIGKSTLVRHFLAGLKRRNASALVLASRCHPQETLPFRALDAAMDALALHAATLSDLVSFAPALTQAAARLFPALWSVPALAEHRAPETFLDETDLRAQGFEELRDLFGRLAALGPLVLWIDDVQWDDADSVALLETVLRPRGAPPMLLVLGSRGDSGESLLVRRLLESPELVPLERIELGALGERDVAKLAAVFLGDDDPRIAGVVRQSGGNPFLACELARYVASSPKASEVRDLSLSDLVAARLRDLAPDERALLDVAAIAVRPLALASALEAAHLAPESQTAIFALRDAYLLRQGASPAGDTVAPYHDKIAEATEQLLSTSDRRAVNRAIAETLERREPDDAAALCVHWEGAGETVRAAAAAYRAAGNAAATLAFGRAAELYDKALALRFEGAPLPTLLARAAAAHANDGRAQTAARRYLDASRALGDDVRVAEVRTFKRLAAEQYVKSGYVKEGWEVMRSVLDGAGVAQPASPRAAMLGALGRRLRFLFRRIDVDQIGDRRIPEDEQARLEILWTASTSMSMVNVTLSDAFRTLHLERILDVGDASSIARALAYEVALEAHVGGPLLDWHAERLLGHARKLVARTGDPYDAAWLELGVANQAFCAGRFGDAVTACTRSDRILREKCSGVAWERTTVAAFLLTSLAMLGDLVALREHTERFVVDAENRGDLFGIAEGYSGECVLAWWSLGRGDAALATAHDAVVRQGGDAERWPEKTYRRGQLTELMGTVHLRLLAGDPWPAWRMLLEQWDGLKSAMLPSLQFYRSWLRHGRARVALAAAEVGGNVDGWTRERLLADARDAARTMDKDKKPFGAPWAALIDGGLASSGGDTAGAASSLARAVDGFERAGMALYREAARWRLGDLTRATHDRERADAWLRAQGVLDVPALVNALVPGFGARSRSERRG